MTADDSSSSEAQVDVEDTSAVDSGEDGGGEATESSEESIEASSSESGDVAESSDEAEALDDEEDENAVPEDTAAAYKIALDCYLGGDLRRSLQIVDTVLERDPETELKPRLQRLRRRAEDRIIKEGGDLTSEEDDASGETEAVVEDASEETEAVAEETTEAPVDEAKADETPVDETKADEAKADETKADETKADEAKADEAPADEAKADETAKTASGRSPVAEGRVIQKRSQPSSGSQGRKAQKPRTRPGGVQRRVSGAHKAASPGVPSSVALKPQFDRINNGVNKLANSFRVVEGSVVKVAEAYQKIARTHKRKEQAYDQLYEELRGYKENFLLQAQKPLFKDIILLFDAIRRVLRNAQGHEGDTLPRELVEDGLKHIRDEVLELLYRRDIELIEEYPDKLNIDFQKPVKRIDVDDPAEDRDIVEIVREGFRLNGATMRPQEVVVKRCVKESES